MGDRFEIRRAIAVFYEKALVIFQEIRCARHGHLEPVGVIVFDHFSCALFEIGCRETPRS
jgi:hypothetical protein